MKTTLTLLAATLMFAASASAAAGPSVAWSKKDVTTAIRAIGYPKPHPVKLACAGIGTGSDAYYDWFRCKATYRPHHVRRFVVGGEGEGGWLCAGKTPVTCTLLRHGFVTSLAAAPDRAARGYLQDTGRFPYQVVHFCQQTTSTTYSCPFTVDAASVKVTVSFKQVKGGYVTTAAVS